MFTPSGLCRMIKIPSKRDGEPGVGNQLKLMLSVAPGVGEGAIRAYGTYAAQTSVFPLGKGSLSSAKLLAPTACHVQRRCSARDEPPEGFGPAIVRGELMGTDQTGP